MFELDIAFQLRLRDVCDQQLLSEPSAQLRRRLNRLLLLASQSLKRSRLRAQASTHATELDAIAGDDPEAARAAMEAHIDEATVRIKEWMSR